MFIFIIEPSEILAWKEKLLFTDVNCTVILDLTNSSYELSSGVQFLQRN